MLLLIAIASNIYCAILQYLLLDIAKFRHYGDYYKIVPPLGYLFGTTSQKHSFIGSTWKTWVLERFSKYWFWPIFHFFQEYSTIHPFAIRTLIWGLLSLVSYRFTVITPCYDFFRKILKSRFERRFRLYWKRDEP